MRKTFIDTLIELARKDPKIFLITADMGFNVLEPFAEEFPDRFLNTGITEQATVSMAAGLALSGYKPYVYSITPFVTMRCYEQVRLNVAYMNANVKLIGVGAGFEYGVAGATHHAIEDISLMRSLPNMQVLCPGDNLEAKALLEQSARHHKPSYIRIGRNPDPFYHAEDSKIELGKASILNQGQDLAIITTSNTLGLGKAKLEAMQAEGKNPYLISMHTIKPFDKEIIHKLIKEEVEIISIEENNIIGGLGSAIAEVIAESGQAVKFKRLGIPDEFTHHIGNQNYHRKRYGLN
ncbi:MAG: 1-deoxy-D-xylulose-5-phosphate synthase [Candidatus Melainabacteria bacterium]|nr:1-deoxy-D-xylulose-5-phosphate synthase [Candidatus Melainabacteria bacterium]